MKPEWKTRSLGEVCEIVNGGTPKTEVSDFWGGPHQWITPAEMGKRPSPYVSETERTISELGLRNSSARILPPLSIVLSSRAPIGHLAINTVPMATNQGCKGIVPSAAIDYKFLYYFLLSNVGLLDSLGTGATFKELSGGKLKGVLVPVPSLDEQKRIVAALDEAFEGLVRARENVEVARVGLRDLLRAAVRRALIENADRWERRKLGDCFRLKSGDGLTAKQMVQGAFPVYGGNGIAGSHNKYNLEGDNVVIGRVGALCGNARRIRDRVWLTDNAFKVIDIRMPFDFGFLTWLLNFHQLRSHARQTAQPVISNSSLENVELQFPTSVELQSQIAASLDEVEADTEALRAGYERKLADLKHLRQSLLQKAFSGKLTGGGINGEGNSNKKARRTSRAP